MRASSFEGAVIDLCGGRGRYGAVLNHEEGKVNLIVVVKVRSTGRGGEIRKI